MNQSPGNRWLYIWPEKTLWARWSTWNGTNAREDKLWETVVDGNKESRRKSIDNWLLNSPWERPTGLAKQRDSSEQSFDKEEGVEQGTSGKDRGHQGWSYSLAGRGNASVPGTYFGRIGIHRCVGGGKDNYLSISLKQTVWFENNFDIEIFMML